MELAPHFKTLRLGSVKPAGWIREQFQRDLQSGFAGCLDRLTDHAANDLFRDRIGGTGDMYEWWDGETRGNWLWGLTLMAHLAEHPQSVARVRELISDLKATQDDDGYLGVYVKSARYATHLEDDGELWTQGRALLSLLAYYEFTGDASCLQVVEDVARLTMKQYGPQRPYFNRQAMRDEDPVGRNLTGLTHGLNYVDVMEWLYELTGNTAYRDFGTFLYADFCSIPGRFANDDFKLRYLPLRYLPLSNHAAHAGEHLRVLIWAYLMTGSAEMKDAIGSAFSKIALCTVPSGALIGDESVHGTAHPDIGYEYCTMTELLWSLTSAAQKLGESSYGDWIENLAFNAGQGARTPDGKAVSYLSLENRFQAVTARLDPYHSERTKGGRFKFSPTHEDIAVCCNPNAIRFMPHYVSRMWMRLNQGVGLVAYAYGPSTVTTTIDGVDVTIDEVTDYPFLNSVQFTVHVQSSLEFELWLRKPGWSVETAVSVQGAAVRDDDGYLVVSKLWSPGDAVTLTFTPRIDTVPTITGEYAVRRGPLQYAQHIPHRSMPIKDYPVPGFHDSDVIPQDLKEAYQVPILDMTLPDLGLSHRARPDADLGHPWDNAPEELVGEGVTLVPIGCTILRRSTFPVRQEGQ